MSPAASPLHADAVTRLLARVGPSEDVVLAAMTARADREGFPTVGPEVGRTLALVTRLLGARRALELGSGFGYSAYWVARALPDDGRIVLTDRDAALLADARTYLERGGLVDRAAFEHGDAIEVAARLDGPFDLVVLDHDTRDYVEGFDAIRDLVGAGGAVVADNVVATEHTDDVLAPEVCQLVGDVAADDAGAHDDRSGSVRQAICRVHVYCQQLTVGGRNSYRLPSCSLVLSAD